ncbi:hypothetical protein MLD38_017641 [Melastoma candidum]|uniref:Uncharacterized protein n=1 Tax=Melastoma candidum TaxID=119954 RepID=A0ACB9QSE0_9MYRT|nr:hypothetical protein MLD38_017641 [Melastoma candidum]
MSDHHRLGAADTTTKILRSTARSVILNPIPYLLLSLLLLSFRSLLFSSSLLLSHHLDRLPSHLNPHIPNHRRGRPREPFLRITVSRSLDDSDLLLSSPPPSSPSNSTRFTLPDLHPSLYPRVVSPSLQFKFPDRLLSPETAADGPVEDDRKLHDLGIFLRGLGFEHQRDAAAFFFMVSFLSAAYGWIILGFLVIYSCVLGIAFVAVVEKDVLGGRIGFNGGVFGMIWRGSKLGLKRLSGFLLMKWAVRDAITQVLGLWFFGEVEDQLAFFKLFIRLKMMPFDMVLPWIRGFDKEVYGFLLAWFLIDVAVGFVFSIDVWIVIVDSRKSGKEIVKEGFYLVLTMLNQAVQLKCLEAIICGPFVRWISGRIGGRVLVLVFQALMEVYFAVAWLYFYFSARCHNANSDSRRFVVRELEAVVQG